MFAWPALLLSLQLQQHLVVPCSEAMLLLQHHRVICAQHKRLKYAELSRV